MVRRTTLALGAAVAALAAVAAWAVSTSRSTARVPYTVVDRLGDVELRRYPTAVVAETTADSETAAFRRLFRYISGANRDGDEVSMTAPVETGEPGREVSMTAPVESEATGGGVRMAFFLPAAYEYGSAPRPTDPAVRLVEVPERTVAVRTFSWWATDGRVERFERALLDAVAAADLRPVGDPVLLRYDGPGTPPFLRTNEVGVEVRRVAGGG